MKFEDYTITGPCNVMGIIPLIKKEEDEPSSEWNLELFGFKLFKEVQAEDILMKGVFKQDEVVIISQTKFSKEYIDKALQTARVFFTDIPRFFLPYDKEKGKYLEDNPCIIVFDKLCFVLAPGTEEWK